MFHERGEARSFPAEGDGGEGLRTPGLKEKLRDLEGRVAALNETLAAPAPSPVRLHPNLAALYRRKVSDLAATLSLGPSTVLTCEQARNRAISIVAAARNGADPAAERDAGRKAITVKELAERFDREHIAIRVKASTAKEYRRNLERFILPALGQLTVTGTTRADVAKFHHDLRHIPYQANALPEGLEIAQALARQSAGDDPRVSVDALRIPQQLDGGLSEMDALCLLQDKDSGGQRPVVIFAPATLCEQWQTEMIDKLGIPCARWETQKKVWLDHDDRVISPAGREQIARCPLRIGIVSTGLMMRDSLEKQHLLGLRFALVILDEAHKARSRQGFGRDAGTPNELLAFATAVAVAVAVAERSDHVLLGTATPIQTRSEDLWDLMRILHRGKGRFVLGNEYSRWHQPDEVLPLISGQTNVEGPDFGWELLRSPLPVVNSTDEPRARRLFSAIRQDLGLNERQTDTSVPITQLSDDTREILEEDLERKISGATFFQRENPFIRHIVLRKRADLEASGLLPRIGVDLHPDRRYIRDTQRFDALFEGKALRTNDDFREAYREPRAFGKALSKRGKGSGFMKNLMEQRICSSIAAGLNTARTLLAGRTVEEETEDQVIELTAEGSEEKLALERLISRLERIDGDPKLQATIHFLDREKWLDHGAIIFSQYYDTAKWIADSLAALYPDLAIGLYAGASRSRLYQKGESVSIERETLKKMVAEHETKIMVATDAACEGLNLQTLGTLINIDLPWNPTRLEQRIGRIKRFGQAREKVDMLNLVNEQTVDEKVYNRLSERMRDRFDLFGSLPDTIRDEWIDDIETLGEKMDEYINAQREATGFDLRYNATAEPSDRDSRECTEVLSRRDFAELMRNGWT